MKIKSIIASLTVAATLLSGCASKATSTDAPKPAATETATKTATDATATASVVDNQDAFLKAVAKDGKWIIAITKDLTVDKEIVVDGDFKNGKKDAKTGAELLQRKIALYSQDDKRNITARFTLTAPKMTFNSIEGSLQHGTFKGDLYVSAKNFQLIDATVEGNVYLTTDDAKSTFKMDAKSKVTGEIKK